MLNGSPARGEYWHGSLPGPRTSPHDYRSFGFAPNLSSRVIRRLCVRPVCFPFYFLCITCFSTILSIGEMTAFAPISGSILLYGKSGIWVQMHHVEPAM